MNFMVASWGGQGGGVFFCMGEGKAGSFLSQTPPSQTEQEFSIDYLRETTPVQAHTVFCLPASWAS